MPSASSKSSSSGRVIEQGYQRPAYGSPMSTSPVAMPTRTWSVWPPGVYRTDRGGNGEAGTHGAFGIGLAGFRPAEIDQYPVTDVTRDEAVKLLDGGGDACLVGADDLGADPRHRAATRGRWSR